MANPPIIPDDMGQVRSDEGSIPARNGHIGWIVAGSLATGVVAALLLVAAPFIRVQENDVTGAVLWGFVLGWAMLAVLSVRFTDQPQRWAVAPTCWCSAVPAPIRRTWRRPRSRPPSTNALAPS